ncbi:MAG: CBS domain-containing protein [Magnetococcus sp. DMHC-8]
MDIPDQIARKARPFFLNFFQRLADDLNTLVDAPVECTLTDMALAHGEEDLGLLFETENSVAHALEDGLHTGTIHMIMDASAAIALSGLMMMLPKAVVQKNVKVREYTEEIQEGFHEVANQIMGSLNTRMEEKLAGSHLFLDAVEHMDAGAIPAPLNPAITYLDVGMEITVSDFRAAPVRWLLARKVADTLLKLTIPPSPEEAAMDGEAAAAAEPPPPPVTAAPPPPKAPDVAEDYEFDARAGDLLARSSGDALPAPDEPGGLRVVMTLPPFTLNEQTEVMQAVVALFQDGYRYIGVERQGALLRIISQSDVRRVMGAFYGSKAVTPREKALLSLPVGRLNEQQRLVSITATGSINQAADLLKANQFYALPVVNGIGMLRGFVPVHSLLAYFRKKA